MARAGYDPRDMAGMFNIIAQRSGAGGPEWLSDHPNPGNRSEAISREARALRVCKGAFHDLSFFPNRRGNIYTCSRREDS